MELNIREMIDGGPARLRYVFRYSTSRVEHPESVAEHSYYVAFYCLMISKWLVSDHYSRTAVKGVPTTYLNLNIAKLLERAIVHDLEEAVSGDVPRSFKHSNPHIKAMLDKAAAHAFFQVVDDLLGQTADDAMRKDEMCSAWEFSKDSSLEGCILEFADFLAVLGFMMQEGAHDGNKVIKRHVAEMNRYFAKFEGRDYDLIRPLVQQAGVLTREIL